MNTKYSELDKTALLELVTRLEADVAAAFAEVDRLRGELERCRRPVKSGSDARAPIGSEN